MIKETVICIIIVSIIIFLDVFTQIYTDKSASYISDMFSDLKTEILNGNKEKAFTEIDELNKKWTNMHDKLAYYIEHDELEKVDTAIVKMKSYIESDDYASAIAELDAGRFVMEHIKNKYAFNLQNIF